MWSARSFFVAAVDNISFVIDIAPKWRRLRKIQNRKYIRAHNVCRFFIFNSSSSSSSFCHIAPLIFNDGRLFPSRRGARANRWQFDSYRLITIHTSCVCFLDAAPRDETRPHKKENSRKWWFHFFSPLLRETLGNEKFSIETMRPSLQQQMSDGSERCKVSITKHNRIQLGDVGGRNRLLQHYRCAYA